MTQTLTKIRPEAALPSSPPRHYKWWRTALELTILLPLGVLLLEGGFNLAGVGEEEFLEPDATLGVRHIAGKKVVWRLEGYSDESFNSAGLRDSEHPISKSPAVYRVALLGDSATEGMQVPLGDTYGKQMERLLNAGGGLGGKPVEVINFGCSSYSNGQELLQLKHQVLAYSPDLVVMMYNRGDYVENIRDPRTLKAEPRPYFYRDAAGSLQQDNAVMEANKHLYKRQPLTEFLRKNSRIYGVLSHLNLALSLNEPMYAKLKNSLSKKLDRAAAATNASYKQTYPIQDVWQVTESIVKETGSICARNGAKFMVVCFPNIVNDNDYKNQIKRLQSLSDPLKYAFADLTYPFMYSADAKTLFLKYHFSSAGHKLAAEKIAAVCSASK